MDEYKRRVADVYERDISEGDRMLDVVVVGIGGDDCVVSAAAGGINGCHEKKYFDSKM